MMQVAHIKTISITVGLGLEKKKKKQLAESTRQICSDSLIHEDLA